MANIFLIGFMGTGKSAISSYISEHLGMKVIEMDETIEEREKMIISDIFKEKGEEYFRNAETQLLMEIGKSTDSVVSCGGGTPMRQENVDVMKNSGKIVLLSAKPETIFERVRYSHNRPLLENNMSVEYIAELLEKRREKYEAAADVVVVTDGRTRKEIAEEIMRKIK